ncbi:MAG TPA: nuclear transport factor 2 family protein [Acidobacteriaceae bacterium]|nr:nuclear transport factor 2 family protein [Acidobacteriaceae bacterium]
MSPQEQQRAISLLREAYAAFNRNDIPAAVHAFAADIEWQEPAEFPGGGMYRGRAAVARYLTNSRADWAEGASEPVRFLVHGNRIVVYVHARFRTNGADAWTDVSLADVYTFRNGTPIAMHAFADRNAALQWAGIPHQE